MRRSKSCLALTLLPALGCATAHSRGVVEDTAGAAIPGAPVRLVGAADRTVAATRTDAHGCFFLQRRAPKGEKRFTLEIGAEGYEPARRDVALQPPIFLVTLVPASSGAASRIRPATAEERSEKWEKQCIPLFAGGGAQELSPN
jgi:hypothetical protein